jgi:cytochrome P450
MEANEDFRKSPENKSPFLRRIYSFIFKSSHQSQKLPRLKGHFLLGRLRSFLKTNGPLNNFIAAGKLASQDTSGMCRFRLGLKSILFITKSEHIKHVVIENKDNVSSQAPLKLLKVFFGSSIFVDPEDLFEKKKTIYAKWLNKKFIMSNYENGVQCAIQHFFQQINSPILEKFNLTELTRKFALYVVLKNMLQFLPVEDAILAKVGSYLDRLNRDIFNAKNFFKWNTPAIIRKVVTKDSNPQKLKNEIQTEFRTMLFDDNEEQIKNTENFIRDIWTLNDPALTSLKESLNDIFGDANVALIAGIETTASTLQFAIKRLCAHPEIQQKLREEIKEKQKALSLSRLPITEIYQLPYLDSVIKETLRIYPPVIAVLRQVKNSFKIDEIKVSPNQLIIFSPYVTHRQTAIWGDDIESFRPERFLNDNKTLIDTFVPFGKGPHGCIGRDLALVESKALIAELVANFTLTIEQNDFELTLEQGALKPKNPSWIQFKRLD